ncbi:MAG: hypothetical protein WAO83_10220 [Fuerstiella sp.]
MFRCQMCAKVSAPRVKSVKVTVASRPREYRGNVEDFPARRFGRFREPAKPRDRGGKGHEIVKELMVCSVCGEVHQKKWAAEQAALKAAAKAAAAEQARLEEAEMEYAGDE